MDLVARHWNRLPFEIRQLPVSEYQGMLERMGLEAQARERETARRRRAAEREQRSK